MCSHLAPLLPERSAYFHGTLPSVARYPNRLQSNEIFLYSQKE